MILIEATIFINEQLKLLSCPLRIPQLKVISSFSNKHLPNCHFSISLFFKGFCNICLQYTCHQAAIAAKTSTNYHLASKLVVLKILDKVQKVTWAFNSSLRSFYLTLNPLLISLILPFHFYKSLQNLENRLKHYFWDRPSQRNTFLSVLMIDTFKNKRHFIKPTLSPAMNSQTYFIDNCMDLVIGSKQEIKEFF